MTGAVETGSSTTRIVVTAWVSRDWIHNPVPKPFGQSRNLERKAGLEPALSTLATSRLRHVDHMV
jgi:hypothetical protein